MAENVLIGVIGGSGLYHLDNLTFVLGAFLRRPYRICSLPSGIQVAFLARHGTGHTISPSAVPARANIAALKSLGVRAIVAFSAVGSLREEISPGSFALPTQIIDRTKGIRPASFFEAFGDPFSGKLVSWLEERVRKALDQEGRGLKLFTDKCIVCMEGPQFSTRAESIMYRQWGGDLINMSVLPEAKLAREAELRSFADQDCVAYALIATATDYDAWRPHSDTVTAAEVFKTLKANAETSRLVAATVLDELHAAVSASGENFLLEQVGSMSFSIMPRSEKQDPEHRKKLAYVLPEYFSGEQLN
ncbi:nucleoside phosphorylase domain-containing protein [Armillaria novae-zelandiae]|uniref:S-methyl-5'-thioadenosine phosphorylase n=1 Tax=Armillaria novae-zelandiae TaxID=153914 RepID=A0AA39PTS4_9AGAR|nr:nucleoside phosphorylase domain-containing protein [Armillaria novae-zelandiae]